MTCAPIRLYRARLKALDLYGADHKASYSKLDRYTATVNQTNLGSTIDLHITWALGDLISTFKRFFIRFDAQRRGFIDGCRLFIRVDGCHLRGTYQVVLLTAIEINVNYGIYPLAIVIVENENQWSWGYFLQKFYEQVGVNGGEGLTFMTDRHNGILIALKEHFPCVDKRYYCRHIYVNFKQKCLEQP